MGPVTVCAVCGGAASRVGYPSQNLHHRETRLELLHRFIPKPERALSEAEQLRIDMAHDEELGIHRGQHPSTCDTCAGLGVDAESV